MLRALILTLTLFALLPSHSTAQADGPGTNAALQYWRAFATMQKLSTVEEKLLETYLTIPLDDQAKALVAKSDYALRLMHQGAAMPKCEWGIDWKEEGVEGLLPQLGAARTLSAVACLRARIRMAEGKGSEAIQDLVDAMSLAHHASLDGSLIGVLVGYSIDARVYETLAAFLPKLDAKLLASLQKRLDDVPAANRPAIAIRQCEENTMDWLVRRIKLTNDKEGLINLLVSAGITDNKPGDKTAKAKAFVEECGGSGESMIKHIDELRPSYQHVAKILDLPFDQFEKANQLEMMKWSHNPVFKLLFPAVAKVRESQARADVRQALFKTALAIVRDGRDALKAHPDPIIGGQFEYHPFEGGFELQSKYKGPDGQTLKLTVGQRG